MPKRKRFENLTKEPAKKSAKYDWNALMQNEQLNSLRVQDLKIYLRDHNLKRSGIKQALIDRIKHHFEEESGFTAACNNLQSIFRHSDDHKQFIRILLPIEESKMIKVLDVPSVISALIAEYATGNIVQCASLSQHCKQEIYFIHEHYEDCINADFFRHSRYNDEYFCSHCSNFTTQCPACLTPQWTEHTHWCTGCDNIICFNKQCKYYPLDGKEHYCDECQMIFCSTNGVCELCEYDGDMICYACEEDKNQDDGVLFWTSIGC